MYMTAALQLNAENVFKYIKYISERWRDVGYKLGINTYTYDWRTGSNDDRLMHVIKKWLQGEGHPPSWRRLIYALDKIGETTTADGLRGFAEPVQGKAVCMCSTSNCRHVSHTMLTRGSDPLSIVLQ